MHHKERRIIVDHLEFYNWENLFVLFCHLDIMKGRIPCKGIMKINEFNETSAKFECVTFSRWQTPYFGVACEVIEYIMLEKCLVIFAVDADFRSLRCSFLPFWIIKSLYKRTDSNSQRAYCSRKCMTWYMEWRKMLDKCAGIEYSRHKYTHIHNVIPNENQIHCHQLALGRRIFVRKSVAFFSMWTIPAHVNRWICMSWVPYTISMWTHSAEANYRQRLICGLNYKPQGHFSSEHNNNWVLRANACNWFLAGKHLIFYSLWYVIVV